MTPEDMLLLQQLVQMGYPPDLALQVVQAQSQGALPLPDVPDLSFGDGRGSLRSMLANRQFDAMIGGQPSGPVPGFSLEAAGPFSDTNGAAQAGFIPPMPGRGFPQGNDGVMSNMDVAAFDMGTGMGDVSAPDGYMPAGGPREFEDGSSRYYFANPDGDKERSMARPNKPSNILAIVGDLMRGAQKSLPEQAAPQAQRNAFGNNPKAVQNRVNRESKVMDQVNRESPYKPQPKPPVRFSKPAAPAQKRLAPAGGAARNRY